MKHQTGKVIVNYTGFQIGWFLLVLTQSAWALIALALAWLFEPNPWVRILLLVAPGTGNLVCNPLATDKTHGGGTGF